ncbi:MAG: TMEM43 family protein [Alloprevotella sp.]|nr:TMEM43 family protein [Alloprevotella sp.]
MAYTETTTTGYGTRVGRSFKGIGTGIIMFFAGTALLWWNEGRAVKTDKMLNEAEKVTVEMENPNKLQPEFEGELVCASAVATTTDSLTDTEYGLGATAIALTRKVEYYQWVESSHSESKDKFGGKEETVTTYTYDRQWVSSPVNSDAFKDPAYQGKNFTLTQAENKNLWAENVTFGAYKLPEGMVQSITSREPIVLDLDKNRLTDWDKNARIAYERRYGATPATQTAAQATAVPDSLKTTVPDSIPQENKVDLQYVHQSGNVLYFGRTPQSPEVGDVRITFEKTVPAMVTIIGKVSGDTFKPFKAKNGKTFSTLVMGRQTADEIYEAEHTANNMWLWVLRLVGILLVINGLKGIFGFLETLLKVVPFVANIVGWGVGLVCTVIGIAWSLIIIAIAWLFYRPLLGIALLALAGFLVWVFAFKGKDKLKELAQRNTAGRPVADAAPQPAPAAPAAATSQPAAASPTQPEAPATPAPPATPQQPEQPNPYAQ